LDLGREDRGCAPPPPSAVGWPPPAAAGVCGRGVWRGAVAAAGSPRSRPRGTQRRLGFPRPSRYVIFTIFFSRVATFKSNKTLSPLK
jgi:hypothetical protein